MAAAGCSGRRLSDLLQEQQEPFLLRHAGAAEACRRRLRGLRDGGRVYVSDGGGRSCALGDGVQLCGVKAARRRALPLRWGLLAGCFSCGARQRFRRLPRAGGIADCCDAAKEFDNRRGGEEEEEGDRPDGGRQHSPVSVLELHSDGESPTVSHFDTGEEEDDDEKPSTSGSPPPSDHDQLGGGSSLLFQFYKIDDKIVAVEAEEETEQVRTKSGDGEALHEQAIVSAWERIAADISRIPRLVELDLSASVQQWRRLVGEEEARRVAESIEAMIFEEVRWEAVRDMLCLLA
ncbi:hypothetical protein ACP70R_023864 [Stipagrostis hirtigluma subsp. patula]